MHILDLIMFLVFLLLIVKLFKDDIDTGANVMIVYIFLYLIVFVFPLDYNWIEIFSKITW